MTATLADRPVREAVCEHLARAGARPVDVELRVAGPFATGHASRGLERVDARVTFAPGRTATVALVLKHTVPAEVAALRALDAISPRPAPFPELVAAGEEPGGAWVLLPLLRGSHPPDRHAAPPEVFDALASMHVHWEGRTGELAGLEAIEPDWWRRLCLGHALPLVAGAIAAGGGPALEAARDALLATADDARVAAALAVLPRTLVHGDMHDANIIVGEAGVTIVDWGTARLGPGILDVANIAAFGSANHRRYLRACERLGAPPAEPWLVDLGYQWAQVQITTQYLGWVATSRPEDELAALLRTRAGALTALGRALDGGP